MYIGPNMTRFQRPNQLGHTGYRCALILSILHLLHHFIDNEIFHPYDRCMSCING